jgi:hypothetical protein
MQFRIKRRGTTAELLRRYRQRYTLLVPSNESKEIAKTIWNHWEQEGNSRRPDIEKLADHVDQTENKFFQELVDIASEISGKEVHADYCPFLTLDYNFSAVPASDGYIVLIDEAFFQMVFGLIFAVTLHSQTDAFAGNESAIRTEIKTLLRDSYLERRMGILDQMTTLREAIGKDQITSIFANYVFQGIKTFVLGHELGHHALGHTSDSTAAFLLLGGRSVEIPVNNRAWADEFEADAFGYQVYLTATQTTAQRVHTYFEYRVDFAPILFFDICDWCERWGPDSRRLNSLVTASHPPLEQRKTNLIEKYKIDETDEMYLALKHSLHSLLVSSSGLPQET